MAGSGVNVGGTAMLRTRRRDVSIKPNRRLDRKSSRGMIYENEELRLRTININAEVEQGQNDIKKLRRENEQLRREIWSLRDEYDKLEELVKNQSSHGSSDELEGRSGDENNIDTEYSGDEDVEEEEEEEEEEEDEDEDEEGESVEEEEEETIEEDGVNKREEEDLENVENQKISSEKMSSSLHRLHVEFDDLSVVDEEEELQKKDKEKKDSVISEDLRSVAQKSSDLISIDKSNSNFISNDINNLPPYFSPKTLDLHSTNLTASEKKYFTDCPFVFPNPSDPNYPKMLPMDNSNILMSPCSKIYNGEMTPLPNLDTPAMGPVDPIFGLNEYPEKISEPLIDFDKMTTSSNIATLPQRRNIRFKQPAGNFFNNDSFFKNSTNNCDTPNSGDAVTQNGWDFSKSSFEMGNSGINRSPSCEKGGGDKPKHFFAPLKSIFKNQDHFLKGLDTGTSSSSDKTSSTVISRNHYNNYQNFGRKGTADVYVNGGFPFSGKNCTEGFFNQSTENLTVQDVFVENSGSPLVKSVSCQDISKTEPQSLTFYEKLKIFNTGNPAITKSDNTLDNFSNVDSNQKPFKSQLNVTLKLPKQIIPQSPDTPEIPKLPDINYRLFNNPFIQNYQNYNPNFNLESPMTRPLSIQVNESDPRNHSINNFKPRIEDPRLLLMAANNSLNRRENIGFEVTSFEGPNPQTLMHRIDQRLYKNIPNGQTVFPQNNNYANYENCILPGKVPAQTQTSIDGDSLSIEEPEMKSSAAIKDPSVPSSPLTLRRKRILRKERSGSVKDKRPLSPAAQRRKDRLRKQNSVTSSDPPESPVKILTKGGRKFSVTTSTSTAADVHVEKNESRSSSSGQDSPKKNEQRRRVSLYFNAKKRPSFVSSNKIDRRSSIDNIKDTRYSIRNHDHLDPPTTTNSERERTNSVSSRDTVTKGRKMSTGSEKVPWCACWGNGCV